MCLSGALDVGACGTQMRENGQLIFEVEMARYLEMARYNVRGTGAALGLNLAKLSGILYIRAPRGYIVPEIIMYCTAWCSDCRRAKVFLQERGIAFREVNIDQHPESEQLVLRVNHGRRKVPTFEVEGRYFAVSPFNPYQLAEGLNIPLNA